MLLGEALSRLTLSDDRTQNCRGDMLLGCSRRADCHRGWDRRTRSRLGLVGRLRLAHGLIVELQVYIVIEGRDARIDEQTLARTGIACRAVEENRDDDPSVKEQRQQQ